ncbi:MAG: hypothetical protein IJD79_08800 [Clostridia bacterium]|nr:hypothetical protein [Clostridia bacterium]
MIVDLLHNKIVKETITEAFGKSVNDNLIPKLYALYSTSLEGVQMYEDYLNDDFKKDGYWYYPLTVLIAGINAVIWIKWDISNAAEFEDGNPYAYNGEGIDFLIADDVPMAFKSALDGRSSYFEGGCVKTNVTTDAPSVKILVGKYSQTFIDEMTRQITRVIEKACGVSGIDGSSIEIDFVFAPNTYMEHTSENVTYRRLLISAKGCSPRDFWIKWTRQGSSVAFSVNDNVSEEDIVFELGEDVPHKTREKEYRFLVYGNSEKYRVAMGRKNITEWRELIKRAVKRGELNKTTTELERDAHVAEVSDKLSEILEKYGMAIPTAPEAEVKGNAEVANEALRLAVLGDAQKAESEKIEDTEVMTVPEVIKAEAAVEDTYAAEPEEASAAEESAPIDAAEETEADEAAEAEVEDESEAENAADDIFTLGGLEITDEAENNDGDDFDFDKEHEQFEMAIPTVTEPSFADILADFIPKDDDDEEDESDAFESAVSISDIEETESEVFEISKSDIEDELAEDATESEEAEEDKEEDDSFDEYEEAELEDEAVAMDDEDISASDTEDDSEIVEAEKLLEIEDDEELGDASERETEEPVAVPTINVEQIRSEIEEEYAERIAALTAELQSSNAVIFDVRGALAEAEAAADRARRDADKYQQAMERADNALNAEKLISADLRAEIEKQKFAIEQVRLLIDEAANARMLAEAETARIRAEYEELKRENVNLVEAARVAEEACAAAEEKSRACEEKLEEQIELFEKEKIRQKNLFVEAARQAKEENDRTVAELAEAEALRRIEEARLEALRNEEAMRASAEAEAIRQRLILEKAEERKAEEAKERRRAIEQRAYEARMMMEQRARAAAEARAAASAEYARVAPIAAPVADFAPMTDAAPAIEPTPVADFAPTTPPAYSDIHNIYAEPAADAASLDEYAPVEAEVTHVPDPAPVINYTYVTKIVRLLFKRAMDPNITVRIHELISEALTHFGKSDVYMKVKASVADNSTVILNFVEFPEEEFELLVRIINYLGNNDLGIYKIILEEK